MTMRSLHTSSSANRWLSHWKFPTVAMALLICVLFLPDMAIASPTADIAAFQDKRTKSFSTNGRSKAKGINLRIKYPVTWTEEEAERPNIVQKFKTKYKDHLVAATITILNLPNSPKFTKEQVNDESLRRRFVKEMNCEYVSGGATSVDAENAFWVIYRQNLNTAATRVSMVVLVFNVIYDSKMIQIMFNVAGVGENPLIEGIFEEYFPVFQMIQNTVVLPDKWKNNSVEETEKRINSLFKDGKWKYVSPGTEKNVELLYDPRTIAKSAYGTISVVVMEFFDTTKIQNPQYSHICYRRFKTRPKSPVQNHTKIDSGNTSSGSFIWLVMGRIEKRGKVSGLCVRR